MKFLLVTLFLVMLPVKFVVLIDIWQDTNAYRWNYASNDKYCQTFDENCNDSDDDAFVTSQHNKRKSNVGAGGSSLAADIGVKKTTIIPSYHSTHQMPCSCGMEFRLRDLGPSYYPRYIHTGICKQESCGGLLRCTERHYKIRVLKQRDTENSKSSDLMSLPEELRDSWESEIVSVTVACECIPYIDK